MSILFLDIDGVLNGHQRHANGYCGIDSHCMSNLNHVIAQTKCLVVISSAWRYMMPEAMTITGFEYLLKSHGLNGSVYGYTERDEVISKREDQILAYPKQGKWAVVDDLPLQIENFVRTDGRIGMQRHEADMLIKILAG